MQSSEDDLLSLRSVTRLHRASTSPATSPAGRGHGACRAVPSADPAPGASPLWEPAQPRCRTGATLRGQPGGEPGQCGLEEGARGGQKSWSGAGEEPRMRKDANTASPSLWEAPARSPSLRRSRGTGSEPVPAAPPRAPPHGSLSWKLLLETSPGNLSCKPVPQPLP